MNEHEKIALKIFNKYGLEFKTATRAGGWTNAVWLNGDFALRLSFIKGSDRIRREVSLSQYLPDVIGYPSNIAVGLTDDYEWSLSKKIDGNNLSDTWSNLNWNGRTETIRQILNIIDVLHKVDTSIVESISSKKAWYSSFNVNETYSCLEKYRNQDIFSSEQINILYSILERFWEKCNSVTHVLNHGDITMDNLLWSNGRIVSLIDFEHSVIAPPELDLHSIINLAFCNDYNLQSDINIEEFRQYKKDIIKLFNPILNNTYSINLILGYAVLFRMKFLEIWLENPNGKLEKLDAYIKLLSLANDDGGYLSDILTI